MEINQLLSTLAKWSDIEISLYMKKLYLKNSDKEIQIRLRFGMAFKAKKFSTPNEF